MKNKHDPVEFSQWAEQWLKSRTDEWWDQFVAEFNATRPSDQHIVRYTKPLQPIVERLPGQGVALIPLEGQFRVKQLPSTDIPEAVSEAMAPIDVSENLPSYPAPPGFSFAA